MKKKITLLLALTCFIMMIGCSATHKDVDILTTTAPVFTFVSQLCDGTNLNTDCLISENITCLHDYTLQTSQMRAIEGADLLVISGANLEESFADVLSTNDKIVDASIGIGLICDEDVHDHEAGGDEHHHLQDPHIWLAPQNAMIMVNNIARGLTERFPQYAAIFEENRLKLQSKLEELDNYGKEQLYGIRSKELITFHDGFAYLAKSYDLHILHAIEEESGREASAAELIYICDLIEEHNLTAIFVEKNSSLSAAEIISAETGTELFYLNMAMTGDYFEAMYQNIEALKEALG